MLIKFPKDDQRYSWTNHIKGKMIQYLISESLIKRIIKSPQRVEEGIAPQTIAAMQRTQSKKPQEVWVMYKLISQNSKLKTQNYNSKLKIISTWRYPGISPVGKKIYIPEDVWQELEK